MMDEDAALLAGLQMQEAGSSAHGHGMELDPNVHDHDHDPSGLGGMMGVGGVNDEDAFGALDSTTLAEMGRGMQEALHGHGHGDERDRLVEQGEEQEGYNHYSQHHLQQHQHQQDGRQTPSSHDQQQYSSHSHSHQHPAYSDPGLDTDPNNLDPVFQTSTQSLSSSVAGTGFGVHRNNGGTENVSDLRTRRGRGAEGDDQTRHHDQQSYDEHQDPEHRDSHAHEHDDPGDHAEVQHHQPEEVGEEGVEQMEMSLNGAMDAAAAAAAVGMGVGVEGEMMDIGMGMDMGYMGDVQEQEGVTGAADESEGGDRTVEGGEEMEAYGGTGMEQPNAEHQHPEEDKIEGWS
ncbi:hypothetical protein FFLO_06166 [Filobasidium floriforme]|uniref:Uncharacterized protein n=1 Tax=Filobasidium floriforme TaxID=5210 RepID=A0A8K0NQQ1_9TREE|nr:hypothetical protein FFLO_06166 [Filobasidium floriforme]